MGLEDYPWVPVSRSTGGLRPLSNEQGAPRPLHFRISLILRCFSHSRRMHVVCSCPRSGATVEPNKSSGILSLELHNSRGRNGDKNSFIQSFLYADHPAAPTFKPDIRNDFQLIPKQRCVQSLTGALRTGRNTASVRGGERISPTRLMETLPPRLAH